MKHRTFLEEEIRREELAACSSLIAAESENFGALVSQVGLNPATDFAYSDLRECDFSDSDIRGFNFTGADLRGAGGHNITWDKTTNFTGADLSGTSFEFSVSQSLFFDENPELKKIVRRLANSDWLSVELWLGSDEQIATESPAPARIAFELYNTISDDYIKSIILRYSRNNFETFEEYRDFLLSEIAKPNQPLVLKSCLDIIGRLFADQQPINLACQRLLRHDTENVRRAALAATMNGISGINVPARVKEYIRREPIGDIRRYYLRRIANRLSKLHDRVAIERPPFGYRDFKQEIGPEKLQRIADLCIRADELEDITLTEDEKKQINDSTTERDKRDAQRNQLLRRKRLTQIFDDFAPSGIDFSFSHTMT